MPTHRNPSTRCRRCSRGLKDPASIQRGLGPVCAAKSAAQDRRSSSGEPAYFPSGPAALPPMLGAALAPGTYYAAFPDPATDGSGGKVQPIFGVRVVVPDGGVESATFLEDGLDVQRHSPTGFSYGYGGSGPSQLALAILLDHFRGKKDEAFIWNARLHYMAFKAEFLARTAPPEPLVIPQRDIEAWLKEQTKDWNPPEAPVTE